MLTMTITLTRSALAAQSPCASGLALFDYLAQGRESIALPPAGDTWTLAHWTLADLWLRSSELSRNHYNWLTQHGWPAQSFDGASLDGARLVRASLDGASLDGASLDGASLDGASLDGASLDGAKAQLEYREHGGEVVGVLALAGAHAHLRLATCGLECCGIIWGRGPAAVGALVARPAWHAAAIALLQRRGWPVEGL